MLLPIFDSHSALYGYELVVHRLLLPDAWILQHFPNIIGWDEVPTYTELMPHASAFNPLRGNQVSNPYRRGLDRIAAENVRYDCYAEHRETVPFDEIAMYFGWFAVSSTIIVCYLPEHVMRQFGYAQTMPHNPTVSAPITMTRRQLDEVFADKEHHMVPEEARATRAENDWSCVEGYITWYYRVSHPYMIPAAHGDPPRPAHEEILQAHQAELDHTHDLLPRCRQIADTGLGAIADGLFSKGPEERRVVDVMIRLT
ncbi:uncharacterized protein LOC131650002 [Vicia villosa]|uniref:uncharacterized protein LOC131650002 n=1 Tax=Vicia villosa TaxID=3911 RepID=UPI00273B3119|nr:uncharacterized protein LOC131650002 [Vicia villosa]